MWGDIALVLGAYILGSLPHLSALARLRHLDLDGDLHINLWRRGGRWIGLAGILGEFAKGVIPVLVGYGVGFSLLTVCLAGLAAVSGQMWPAFSRFDGEKGNSIGLAMAGALALLPVLLALVPIAIGATVRTLPRLLDARKSMKQRLRFGGPPSRSLPLGMALGFLALPAASWWLGEPPLITLSFLVLFVLIMVRRLTAGLGSDLAKNGAVVGILVNRLLYDRGYL